MTHPEDLLAGYVDGTLPQDERVVVDTHLTECSACREEVVLATQAVTALSALSEESVPFGVTGPVLAEARRSASRRQPVWQRAQWAVGLAAAACLVLVALVLLPQITGGGSNDAAGVRAPTAELETGDELGAGTGTAEALQVEVLDQNLDERDVKRIATAAAKMAPVTPERDTAATFAAPDEAISCIEASGATVDERDVLVRMIQARYLGTPAYLGVFHEGPGGGQPPDKIVVWVVSSADCAILTLVSQNV